MSKAKDAGSIVLKDGLTVKDALANFFAMTKPSSKAPKKRAKRKTKP